MKSNKNVLKIYLNIIIEFVLKKDLNIKILNLE